MQVSDGVHALKCFQTSATCRDAYRLVLHASLHVASLKAL